MRTNRIALISAIIVALASQNASFAAPPQRGGPGGGPGRETRSIEYRGAATYDADAATQNQTYSSEETEVVALLVKGGVATVTNPTVTKKGAPSGRSDSYDFYGVNAAALATNGGVLDISGGSITTESAYSSGLFAYGTGVIKARGVAVATKEHNSGGVMVTGGGTLDGVNLNIVTEGGSSAAIRSDRGGGKLNIDGGSYTTNGPGSPTIYSTAEISVKNAELTATKSEGAIIEGRNSIALEKTKLVDDNTTLHGKSTTRKNIFIYQSFSGDAAVGTARFSAKDCEIVTKKGDSIYVTNTSCVVSLTGNTFVNEDKDGWFLRVQREGWGRKGSNGGNVEMTLEKQDVEGNVYLDNISTLKLAVTKGSHYVGAINAANTAKELAITLDAESTLELTADSYVSSIVNADPTGANIKLNGHVLHVGEEFAPDNLPETGSDNEFGPGAPPPDGGQPGEFGPPEPPEGGFGEMGPPPRPNGGGRPGGDAGRPPRRPDGTTGRPPRRPNGDAGRPPRRPDGDAGRPPRRPDGDAGRPPRRPDGDGAGERPEQPEGVTAGANDRALGQEETPPNNLVHIPSAPNFRFVNALNGASTLQNPGAPPRRSPRGVGISAEPAGEAAPVANDYYLSAYPVTNEEYAQFLKETNAAGTPSTWKNGSYPKEKGRHPVLGVSLEDAQAYCDWLSSRNAGWIFRIPTEAEWERAALADKTTRFPWGDDPEVRYDGEKVESRFNCNAVVAGEYLARDPEKTVVFNNEKSSRYGESLPLRELVSVDERGRVQGWIDHNDYQGFVYTDLFKEISDEGGYTTPVDRYENGRNAYGLYDMCGNCWEWTSSEITATNGAERGKTVNAIRGGSWYATINSCAATTRGEGRRASGRYNTVGFRVAADKESGAEK